MEVILCCFCQLGELTKRDVNHLAILCDLERGRYPLLEFIRLNSECDQTFSHSLGSENDTGQYGRGFDQL